MKKLFEILEITESSDKKVIKSGYINMVKKYPPETNPEEFKKIRNAYEEIITNLDKVSDGISAKVRESDTPNQEILVSEESINVNHIDFRDIKSTETEKSTISNKDTNTKNEELERTNKQTQKESNNQQLYNQEDIEVKNNKISDKDKYMEHIKYIRQYIKYGARENVGRIEFRLKNLENQFINTRYSREISYELYNICVVIYKNKDYKLCDLLIDYGYRMYKLDRYVELKNKIYKSIRTKALNKQIIQINKDDRIDENLSNLIIAIDNGIRGRVLTDLSNYVYKIKYKKLMKDINIVRYEYEYIYNKYDNMLEGILSERKAKYQKVRLTYITCLVIVSLGIYIFINLFY